MMTMEKSLPRKDRPLFDRPARSGSFMPLPPRCRRAFTLIELLVVIAIIAILIGLLIPAVQKARATIQRIQCQNNLHQIGVGLHNYENSNGSFPKAGEVTTELSWHVYLLPYIEQRNLYEQFSFAAGSFNGAPNNT